MQCGNKRRFLRQSVFNKRFFALLRGYYGVIDVYHSSGYIGMREVILFCLRIMSLTSRIFSKRSASSPVTNRTSDGFLAIKVHAEDVKYGVMWNRAVGRDVNGLHVIMQRTWDAHAEGFIVDIVDYN